MAGHTSEKRWRQGMNRQEPRNTLGVSKQVSDLCVQMLQALTVAQAAFAEMAEIYSYNGSTIQGLADQLFFEDWSTREPAELAANAEEVAKTQDLFDAVTALNELHRSANNEAVAQEDRYSQLRRMS